MRVISLFLILFFSSLMQFLYAQETPKTLLWRISGNGFTKPSYLYGTMHTGDKRVYYLGDSVYSGIAFCEGFAMEIDPGEGIDTFINEMQTKELEISYRKAVENNQLKQDPYYYKRKQWERDSAYNKLKERYNDLSARDLNRLKRAYKQRDRNEMNTTIDLYLFDLAKTQGKTMGGLEDISGREKALDELGNTFDPDLFLKSQRKKYVDVFEWMIVNYMAADLDKIHEFSKYGATEKYLSGMLYNRNHIMAKRIDSLGNIRSSFCAVGTAHLPGDSGVISLLRKRGFVVEPVFSTKKIEPGDYKIDKRINTLISISDPDSNYVVQMPGKPTELMALTDKLYLRVYKELSNEIMLMCGAYEDGDITNTIDKEVGAMKRYFNWYDIKILSSQKISRQNLDGHEFFVKGAKGYLKLHMFHKDGKTYLFAAGAKTKDSVEAARSRSYLETYTMNLNRPAGESEMVSFVSAGKAFGVKFPAQPKIENVSGIITETKQDITLFTGIDLKKKINYLVMIKEPFKGYFNDFDSSIFKETTSEVLKGLYIKSKAEENILLDNYPAIKIKVLAEAGDKTTVVYTIQALRNNRFYNITVRGLANAGYEAVFDKYINSFQFLPYAESKFENQPGGNNLFSVMAPSPIGILKTKMGTIKNRTDYYAFDTCTAMSYGITALALDKYYYAGERSGLLNEYARFQFNDSLAINNIVGPDSLVYKKTVSNGTYEGREMLLKTLSNNSYTRIRIMQYADSVFILNVKGHNELVTDDKADMFFNSFRFTRENVSTTVFNSKTDLFLKDLQSADSTRSKPAADALNRGFRFPEQDLQKLLDAFLYDYSKVNSNGFNVPLLLSQSIETHTGDVLLDFIKTNYPALNGKREGLKILMINMLSAYNNAQAYQTLKDLLLTSPPAENDYTIALSNFRKFPQMAATLFPGIGARIKDEGMAPVIIELANLLIDSGSLQYSSIKEYDEAMISAAKRMLSAFSDNNNENFRQPYTASVLQMLVRINQKQSRSVLTGFTELQNYNLSLFLILAYAKNNQQVPASLLDWFCVNPERRILIYDELVRAGKAAYFTGQYASQNSFAEAFTNIFTTAEIGDATPKFLDLVAIKDAKVKGSTARFYIYKVTCQFRRSTEVFTAITGPFSTDPSQYSIAEGNEMYLLYRKTFDAKNTDNLFADFIKKANEIK